MEGRARRGRGCSVARHICRAQGPGGKAPHGGVAAPHARDSERLRHTFPVQRRKKCAMMGLFP